jgi:ribosomal protein S20
VQHEQELEERDVDNREDHIVIMLKAIKEDLSEVKHDLYDLKTNMKALLRRIEDIETENKQLRETEQRLMKQVEEDKGVLQNEIALRKLSDQKIANIQVDLRKLTDQLRQLEANRIESDVVMHDVGGGHDTEAVIAAQVKQVKDDLVKMVNQRTNVAPATSPVTDNTLLWFSISGVEDDGKNNTMRYMAEKVQSLVHERLGISINIQEAYRLGKYNAVVGKPRKIRFLVQNRLEAQDIVLNRKKLAGSSFVIWDELTKDELESRNLLWPKFLEARNAKKRVHFKRARLYVEGLEVKAIC